MKLAFSLIFKCFIFMLAIFGIYLTLVNAVNPFETISYFTTLVNGYAVISYLFFIFNLIVKKYPSSLLVFIKQNLMVFLLLTLMVYSFVLIPYITDNQLNYQIFSLKDLVIHYAVPLLVVVDYALFSPKGKIKKSYLFINLLGLVVYLLYLYFYTSLGGRFTLNGTLRIYPYFFLDIPTLGMVNFSLIAVAIMMVVLLLGWCIYQIDELISIPLISPKPKRK
ncbi:MAG: Pr6Pr family membrane protein [Bacilli bacterium]